MYFTDFKIDLFSNSNLFVSKTYVMQKYFILCFIQTLTEIREIQGYLLCKTSKQLV